VPELGHHPKIVTDGDVLAMPPVAVPEDVHLAHAEC